MIPATCIEIHTGKFPILDGEEQELVNEGMYGKALCQYLERELPGSGLAVTRYLCEDWGWWIEVREGEFVLGLQIYADCEADENPERYAIMSSVSEEKKWSWKKFRAEDMTDRVTRIMDRLERLLSADPEIRLVRRHDDFPF